MPIVRIALIQGRDAEVKRDLIRRVTEAVVASTGADPATVRVLLEEVPAEHWGVGGKPKSESDEKGGP